MRAWILGLLLLILAACGSGEVAPTLTSIPANTATPIPDFSSLIGVGGYPLMTRATIGTIPAGARISIMSGNESAAGWVYSIITEDGLFAENVSTAQLDYATGYNPAAPTPIPAFAAMLGRIDYPMVTQVGIGTIPAATRVRITSARRGADGWLYTIVPIDEQSYEEAHEDQLDYATGVVP